MTDAQLTRLRELREIAFGYRTHRQQSEMADLVADAILELHAKQPPEPISDIGQDNHVAFIRYMANGDEPTTIELCDSDDNGAIKVYRHPQTNELAQLREQLAAATKARNALKAAIAAGGE